MTHVVVNGDDLGIAPTVNAAIERAFRTGILTSASLMANMPAFDDAVQNVVTPNAGLGVGVHLVLTSGASVSDPSRVPVLVDGSGTFRHGFFGIRRLVYGGRASAALGQIERELRAQYEKVLALGFRVDHLDGHRHVHMIPEIWRLVVRLAAEYGCPYVRLADERWAVATPKRPAGVLTRNLPKKILLSNYARRNRAHLSQAVLSKPVRTADHIMGILDSGAITPDNLGTLLGQSPPGITEIIVHPGLMDGGGSETEIAELCGAPCAPMDRRFLGSPDRRKELEALTSPSVAKIAVSQNIHLTSFGALVAETPRAA